MNPLTDKLAEALRELAQSIRYTPLGIGPLKRLREADSALAEYEATKLAEQAQVRARGTAAPAGESRPRQAGPRAWYCGRAIATLPRCSPRMRKRSCAPCPAPIDRSSGS